MGLGLREGIYWRRWCTFPHTTGWKTWGDDGIHQNTYHIYIYLSYIYIYIYHICIFIIYIYIYIHIIYLFSEVNLHEGACCDFFSPPDWNTSEVIFPWFPTPLQQNKPGSEHHSKGLPPACIFHSSKKLTTNIIDVSLQHQTQQMGVSKNRGIPKWMVKIMVPNPINDLVFFERPSFMAGLVGPKLGTCQGAGLASNVPTRKAIGEKDFGFLFPEAFSNFSVLWDVSSS